MRDALFACVASLHAELDARATRDVEVIVVESSADGTADALAAAYPSVRVLALSGRANAAAARNIGARAARAELLAFVDADCTVAPGFAAALLAAHARSDGPIAGAVCPSGDEGAAAFVLFCIEFSGQLPPRHHGARAVRFAPTCNLAITKADLFALGGFPEDHERSHDLAFCARWTAEGRAPFGFDAGVRVRHHGPRGLRAASRHLFVLGRASALVRSREAVAARALSGRVFVTMPVLVPLLVPYRYLAIATRLARAEGGARLSTRFVALTPMAVAGLCAWAAGFIAGAVMAPPK